MEDFFKHIKDNLESRPEPPFDERVWKDVERSLNQEKENSRPAFLWWWAVLPFLFLLLASNAYTLVELRQANKNISALSMHTDTVFQKQVVYITDTIYRTEVVRETVYRNSPSSPIATNNPIFPTPITQTTFPKNTNGHILPLIENKSGETVAVSTGENIENEPLKTLPENIPLLAINSLFKHSAFPDLFLPENIVQENNKNNLRGIWKKTKQSARQLVPNEIRIGPSASFLYPYGDEVNPSPGYAGGLAIQVEYPFHLRLNAELQFGKVSFETTEMNADLGVPIFTPPNNELEFIMADVPQPFFQFSATLQYPFLFEKKTRPVIGLGLSTLTLGSYDVAYEYLDSVSELESKYELEVSSQKKFQNILIGQVGLERDLGKRWMFQLMLNYRGDLNPKNNPLPHMLGLHSNLLFKF